MSIRDVVQIELIVAIVCTRKSASHLSKLVWHTSDQMARAVTLPSTSMYRTVAAPLDAAAHIPIAVYGHMTTVVIEQPTVTTSRITTST